MCLQTFKLNCGFISFCFLYFFLSLLLSFFFLYPLSFVFPFSLTFLFSLQDFPSNFVSFQEAALPASSKHEPLVIAGCNSFSQWLLTLFWSLQPAITFQSITSQPAWISTISDCIQCFVHFQEIGSKLTLWYIQVKFFVHWPYKSLWVHYCGTSLRACS